MSFSRIAFFTVTSGVMGGGIGFVTGAALGANPLPFAAAYGLSGAITTAAGIALNEKTPLKNKVGSFSGFLFAATVGGGSLVLTAAILSRVGLITLAQAPNPYLAAGAFIANSLALNTEFEQVEDPIAAVEKTHYVKSYPIALLLGASSGILCASLFGWNPVVFAVISAVRGLLLNTNYQIFGCIDRTAGRILGQLVNRVTGTILAVSLLNRNIAGVAASVAFIALSALITHNQRPENAGNQS